MHSINSRLNNSTRTIINMIFTRKAFVLICVHSWFVSSTFAAPLDDQISAFKKAQTQNEAAVIQILQTGIREHRSARAFAAVQPWLNANPAESQNLLFYAGQAAEFAGQAKLAVSFYRKLLKKNAPNPNLAAQAAPAAYRLLINQTNDQESAYLFMREDGARLRKFGRTRQFDSWFLSKAQERGDWAAMAKEGQAFAIYMGVRSAPRFCDELLGAGARPETPVVIVENGTLANERAVVAQLSELPAAIAVKGIRGPAIIFVGLDWATAGLTRPDKLDVYEPTHAQENVQRSAEAAPVTQG